MNTIFYTQLQIHTRVNIYKYILNHMYNVLRACISENCKFTRKMLSKKSEIRCLNVIEIISSSKDFTAVTFQYQYRGGIATSIFYMVVPGENPSPISVYILS